MGPFGPLWATLAQKPVDPHSPKNLLATLFWDNLFPLHTYLNLDYSHVMWEQVGNSGLRGKPRRLVVKPKEGDVLVGR